MAHIPEIYSYWRSSASWRVRIALAYKGVDYEYRAVHLVRDGGEQHSDAYRAKNPMELVPTLEIDGHTLSESLSILRYLEDTRPTPRLVPEDPYLAARAWQIAEYVNAGIQPLQNLRVMLELGASFDASKAQQRAWSRDWIARGFAAVEQMIAEVGGRCAVGDDPTVADVCLVPQVYNARRFEVDLGPFPNITRIDAHLAALPAFQAARPENQPDAVAPS